MQHLVLISVESASAPQGSVPSDLRVPAKGAGMLRDWVGDGDQNPGLSDSGKAGGFESAGILADLQSPALGQSEPKPHHSACSPAVSPILVPTPGPLGGTDQSAPGRLLFVRGRRREARIQRSLPA
jgi:hypothetical protein